MSVVAQRSDYEADVCTLVETVDGNCSPIRRWVLVCPDTPLHEGIHLASRTHESGQNWGLAISRCAGRFRGIARIGHTFFISNVCNATTAAKSGYILAIRLPASVVAALELVPGDEIEITAAGAWEMRVARMPSWLEALKTLGRFSCAMPADFSLIGTTPRYDLGPVRSLCSVFMVRQAHHERVIGWSVLPPCYSRLRMTIIASKQRLSDARVAPPSRR